MKNYQAILTTILGLGVTYLTMKGTIQNYIHFEGVANEIGFAVCGLMIGSMGLLSIDYKKLLKGLL
jgi:hypothetical protein|tara:strand:+ start:1749 stop:1946 length:198 start_codon:yes stop_codon:yes gene_type:complete